MSERWQWSCTDASGQQVEVPGAATEFPTQADAEGWLGEAWPELLEAGVDEVTLERDGQAVYGPMGLNEG